jgi:hypothetical protein
MSPRLYRPSSQQTVWLAALAIAALTYGFVMRYGIIQDSAIGVSCEGGLATWLCASRRTAIALFTPQVFGFVALGAALLHLVRPSFIPIAIALMAAGAGIVLYNTALSALAAALLIFSFARPVTNETEGQSRQGE